MMFTRISMGIFMGYLRFMEGKKNLKTILRTKKVSFEVVVEPTPLNKYFREMDHLPKLKIEK